MIFGGDSLFNYFCSINCRHSQFLEAGKTAPSKDVESGGHMRELPVWSFAHVVIVQQLVVCCSQWKNSLNLVLNTSNAKMLTILELYICKIVFSCFLVVIFNLFLIWNVRLLAISLKLANEVVNNIPFNCNNENMKFIADLEVRQIQI